MTFEELPLMEEKCRECNGLRYLPWVYEQKIPGSTKTKTVNSHKTCEKCHGKGKFLTQFGEALIQLVKDWSPWDEEIDHLRDDIRDLESRDRDRD